MRDKLMRFMQGRYGLDQLSKFLLIVGLIAVLVSSFFGEAVLNVIFYLAGWVFVILCYVRVFSKNTAKRYAENQAFLRKTYSVRTFWGRQKNIWSQRRTYHIYTCPGCRQKIRIPRGKGKIEIRCPKCGTTFVKKS